MFKTLLMSSRRQSAHLGEAFAKENTVLMQVSKVA